MARRGDLLDPRPIEHAHFRRRLLERDAGLQARHQPQSQPPAELDAVLLSDARHRGGDPEIRRHADLEAGELARGHADHGRRDAAQHELTPQDRRVPVEPADPIRPAHYRDGAIARRAHVVLRFEHAPHRRAHAERREEVRRHVLRVRAFGVEAVARHLESNRRQADDVGEHVVLIAKPLVHARREAVHPRLARIPAQQLHEPAWFPDGKIPKHQRVDDAEDGGVRADAEREREDGDRGEPGAAAQHPKAVADVLPERLERASGPDVARHLLDQCVTAPARTPRPDAHVCRSCWTAVDTLHPWPKRGLRYRVSAAGERM